MRRFAFLLSVLCVSGVASAQETRQAAGAQIHLGEVVPGIASELAEIELGNSPPPGSSRLVAREEMERAIKDSGSETKGLKLPESVRVARPAERWNAERVIHAAERLLAAQLPHGASLSSVKTRRSVVTGKRATPVRVVLPKLPRKTGLVTITGTLEFEEDGEISARVPLTLALDLAPEATEPSVARGARMDLVIDQGAASVSAIAYALSDANVGDVVQFRVEATKRVLRGKIESASRARVVFR